MYHGGYHGDLNETFFVGNVDSNSKKLVDVTHECLMQAIDIGESMNQLVTEVKCFLGLLWCKLHRQPRQ